MSQNNKEVGKHEIHEEQKDQQKTPSPSKLLWDDIKVVGKNVDVKARASIYRVPDELRAQNKNAYTPCLVSIGPLHSNDPRLNPGIKKHRVCLFLQRIIEGTNKKEGTKKKKINVIEECLVEMRNLRKEAKESYGENVDDLLTPEMMFIDGCFILELLYHYHEIFPKDDKDPPADAGRMNVVVQSNKSNPPVAPKNRMHVDKNRRSGGGGDPIFGSSVMQIGIQHDLLLLENQLPFKVLETLYTLTLAKILPDNLPNGCRSLTHFVRLYFGDVMGVSNPEEKYCSSGDSFIINVDDEKPTVKEDFHHLLHVIHNRYLPPEEYRSEIKSRSSSSAPPVSIFRRGLACLPCSKKADATVSGGGEYMRSATDLDFAGVKFKARVAPKKEKEEEKEVPFLKIKFHDTKGIFWWWRRARFEIPAMDVTDATEPFLRNLIAFEYCCPEVPNHFTWYAAVMDRLINNEDDVKVLERDGVLYNNLGDRKVVAEMFNNLCKEVCLWELYFVDECYSAVDHSKKAYRKFMAHLRRRWFDCPWTFIAFLVAAIAFTISITQFVRSFLR
ncbi:hypothetical protein U1Q18_013511 [Sarracenia purpurea var. burkii]